MLLNWREVRIGEIPSNSDSKPWAYICSKGYFSGLIFEGAYWKEFYVSKWVGHDNKNSLKHLKTA